MAVGQDNVIVAEISKKGVEHLSFNEAVIKSVGRMGFKKVTFFGAPSQIDFLRRCADGLEFKRIPVVSIISRHFYLKAMVEFAVLVFVLIYGKLVRANRIVFLSIFPPLLLLLPMLSRLLGVNVVLVLHGELEGLVRDDRNRVSSYGFWIRRFFELELFRFIKVLVLAKYIKEEVVKLFPGAMQATIWVDHPIQFVGYERPRDVEVATVGVATIRKHGVLYSKLSQIGCRMAHVGAVEGGIRERYSGVIDFLSDGVAEGEDGFFELLSRVKVAFFPYGMSDYKLTVSGAMLDALAAGCLVVTYRCQFAIYLRSLGFNVEILLDDSLPFSSLGLNNSSLQAAGNVSFVELRKRFSGARFWEVVGQL